MVVQTGCQKAKGYACVWCNGPPTPVCSNNTCAVLAYNPYREYLTEQGLGEDTMIVSSTDGRSVLIDYDVPKFQFSCSDGAAILDGLPGDDTIGLVGLARTQVSLASQISSSFNLAPKFALCLPSSSEKGLGDIYIGGGPYYMPPSPQDQSSSLIRTPLVVNPVSAARFSSDGAPSDEYFISVQDIEISGKRVSFNSSLLSFDKNGVGGTKISTVAPYTILHASIYKRLVKDYVKAAALKKIKRVTSVAPFGACFDSRTASKTTTGPGVPDIDIVLPGNAVSVKLKLSGSNLMVEVKKNVICLAIIDGGAEPRTSIVLGGHQLENRLIEFDLSTSILGFGWARRTQVSLAYQISSSFELAPKFALCLPSSSEIGLGDIYVVSTAPVSSEGAPSDEYFISVQDMHVLIQGQLQRPQLEQGFQDIDIVLSGNAVLVRLKLPGSNLIVEVKKNVICLAIIDGVAEPRTFIYCLSRRASTRESSSRVQSKYINSGFHSLSPALKHKLLSSQAILN
ncbi:eukaryotic aspartyl protease family protein [Artemisia annua]|uniref:Eukaryotic aspartyl protease family protein n=1 Tax=Artemisia annua TaxID=35608 RepID=A0A2U1QKW8_ARTAN|nr:eukaryotic aspartyl protease family protein [Artemisia annua]